MASTLLYTGAMLTAIVFQPLSSKAPAAGNKDVGFVILFKDIFFNNLGVQAKMVAGGFFLGILTVSLLLVNGFVFGYGLKMAWKTQMMRAIFFHGIPETLAYILAASVGLRIFTWYYGFFFRKKSKNNNEFSVTNAAMVYGTSFLFLLLAAAVEACVGTKLIQK